MSIIHAMSPAHILDRQPVQLTRFQQAAADRLYEPSHFENVRIERIWYQSDGLKVAGYLAMPGETDRQLPLLIWNRGGNADRGALDDLTAYLILGIAASWGLVVLASQYRGNKGSEGNEDWGGEDVRDAFNLRTLATEIPQCDPKNLALEGASRGGMTTYRLLSMFHDAKAAVIHAGIADVRRLLAAKPQFQQMIDRYLGTLSGEALERALDLRSMTCFAHQLSHQTPILLMHGDADTVVPIEQSELASKALSEVHVEYEFVIIPGGDHVALKDGSYRQVDQLRHEWFKKYGLLKA